MFRLKELRIECGIKRSELARELNINAGTIANYENEIREAPYDYLIKFAEYFDVSVDYLLGKNTDEKPYSPIQKNLSVEELALINDYRCLSKTEKSRVEEYVSLWKNNKTRN